MAIRYDSAFKNEIKRVVSNYNRRVYQAQKAGFKHPETVNIQELKKSFTNRNDLKRRLKELNLYNRKTANTYQDLIDKRRLRLAKIRVNAEIRRLEKFNSERLSVLGRDSLHTAKLNRKILEMDVDRLSERELKVYNAIIKDNFYRSGRQDLFHRSLTKVIEEYGKMSGVSQSIIGKINQVIRKLSPEQLGEKMKTNAYLNNLLNDYHLMQKDVAGVYASDEMYEALLEILKTDN